MCFSAAASFGASVLLAGIGTVSVKKAKTIPQNVFAVIPFIFCVQQFAEGFLWLSLTNENFAFIKIPATYFFLIFALVVWPVWITLSITLLENKTIRKWILRFLLVSVIILSLILSLFLLVYPVEAKSIGNHIMYSIGSPQLFKSLTNILYFFTAVFPPFISSIKKSWWIGITLIVSYILTRIFYADYIISVWCYFATIISVLVLMIILESNKE